MKYLTTSICMVLLSLNAVTSYSQNRLALKPSLFANYPASVNCTEAQLSSLFSATQGQNISLTFAKVLTLAGPVASNILKYSNLQTVVITLPEFQNTLFALSKQTDQNNNNTYVGKILNPLFADGFELKKNKAGNYQFNKIIIDNILVNCNQ